MNTCQQPCQFCKNCKNAKPTKGLALKCDVHIERDFIRNGTGAALQVLPAFSCDDWRAR